MSGSNYYTRFIFTSTGLSGILSEFKSAAAQIDAQAATLGKMNFTGMNAALPVLKNIDNTLLLMAEHANLLSSSGAKLGNVFTPMSAGATKASAATKSVATSMTQLQAISGQVSSSTARVTSSMSAMGSAGRAALGGVVSAGERAIATMGALSAATMSVGRSMARMGTLAAIPMAGMRGLSGAITGSLLASSAGMLLNPFNAAPLAAGYGVYTQGNVGKAASEAAAKSWQPGMSQKDIDAIKQSIMSNSRASAGQSIYSPTDIAKMWAEYAGMGGDISGGKITDSLSKVFTDYAQAINVPDIGTALNTLVSQNLVWSGQEKAFNEDTLRKTSDMMAMVVAQTKLKGTDLNDLLKDVSPVAKSYGLSQEETYAMTGGMAQLGLNPQQAGMALRRILLRGTPNVSALEKQEAYNQGITNEKGNIIDAETGKEISLSYVNQALDQLDLTWADINPEKNANGIVGVFQDIASKMKEAGMSPEQQQAWMKTVYGLQGVTPAAMLTQNPEYLLDLYNEIKNSAGASSWMSGIMTDNTIDQLKMLGSAVKGSAMDIGAYFEPSVVKLTKFLKDSAVPGLNALGGALAAGDWEGVADIAGSALDFIGEKFASSDDTLTSWINNGIDGLDEFSQRFLDWTTSGGQTNILNGVKEWAQNIWDGIDWGQVGTITSNLSTAFNAAWDQSMEWLSTSIDNVDWSNLGTRAGEALQDAGLWILNKIGDLPWSELTTAATNALTGILLTIDWGSAVSTAIDVGSKIGAAIYNGVSSSNLGILFQNWAGQFLNSMVGAINTVSGYLTALAIQIGIMPSTVGTGIGILGQVGKTALETGKEAITVSVDPYGPYNFIHSTNAQGEYTGYGDFIFKDKEGNYTLKYPWEPVESGSVPILAGSENQKRVAEKFGVDIDTARAIEPYANLREENGLYKTTFDGIGGVNVDEGISGSEALEQFKRDLPAIQWLQKSIMEAKTPAKAYVNGIYTCANFVDDTIKEIQSAEDSDLASAKSSKNVEAIQQQELEQLWSHRLGMAIVPYSSDISHAQIGFNPSGETSAEDVNLFEVTQGNARGYKGQVRSIVSDKSQAQDFAEFFTKYFMDETQPMFNGSMSEYFKYVPEDEKNRLINEDRALVNNQSIASDIANTLVKGNFLNNRAEVAGVGGTIEKSYPGIERSTPVGQDAVDAAYKKTKKSSSDGSITSKVSDDNNNDNDRKSRQSLDKIVDNTGRTITVLEGKNAQGQSIVSQSYKNPEDAAFIKTQLEKQGYEITSKLVPASSIVDQSTKTTEKQTTATSNLTGETTGLTEEFSSLIGELASFAELVNANSYQGIADKLKGEYGVTGIDATYLQAFDERLPGKTDIDALIKGFTIAGKLPWTPLEIIKKSTEETEKHTKKMAQFDPGSAFKTITDAFSGSVYKVAEATESTTSAVQSESDRAATQAKVDSSLQQNLYSTICDIEGFFTPEKVSPLGTFTSPTGGNLIRVGDTWMTKDEYEATMGVSVSEQQQWPAAKVGKVPFYGTLTPEDMPDWIAYHDTLYGEYKKNLEIATAKYQKMYEKDLGIPDDWADYSGSYGATLGGESRTPQIAPVLLGSLANDGNVEVPVEPVVNTEPIDALKSTTDDGLSYDVKVTSNAEAVAAQLKSLGGFTNFTVYVNRVYSGSGSGQTDFANGVSTLPSGGKFSFDSFKTPSYPAFAEGGYTGEYEGGATVHPHEVILNASQQRGVADAIASGPRGNITVHIDARGAIITDGSMDTLVEKVKSALQDGLYR
jgi:TP901 family phage tail tape measure protein